MPTPELDDLKKAKLSIELAELNFIQNQMHTRMQGVYRYIGQGMVLFTAILGVFIVNWQKMVQGQSFLPLLFTPIPFYLLAALQVREQLLMGSHDEYFRQLRLRILTILGEDESSDMLGFLRHISVYKIAGLSGLSTILTVMMYIFPGLGIVSPLFIFHYMTRHYEIPWKWYEELLFFTNLGVCMLLAVSVIIGAIYFLNVYKKGK